MGKEKSQFQPVVIQVNDLIDLLESSGGQTALMHTIFKEKDYYYYYISIGESAMILMLYQADKKFKRYVGTKSSKTIESDEPNSDCPVPIVEIKVDPILELGVRDLE